MSRDLAEHGVPAVLANVSSVMPGSSQTTPLARSFAGIVPEGTRWVILRAHLRISAGNKIVYSRPTGSAEAAGPTTEKYVVGPALSDFGGTWIGSMLLELNDDLECDIWYSNTSGLTLTQVILETFGR